MFLRSSTCKKDGKLHHYWNIVENRRCGDGRALQRHMLYLSESIRRRNATWRRSIEVFCERDGESRALAPLVQAARHDLLEVIDDRSSSKSTIITSQLPIDRWHAWLNDPNVADANLDRLVHRSRRIALKGESLRRKPHEKIKTHEPS